MFIAGGTDNHLVLLDLKPRVSGDCDIYAGPFTSSQGSLKSLILLFEKVLIHQIFILTLKRH